ncbi:MAG: recombinase family protein [Ruminococcus sp.]|nr:recombinase family protein [Ruminococcus sp.]
MEGTMYGYIRVSTKDQNDDRQRIAMKKYGVAKENIFSDKQSGKDFERPGYKALLKQIRECDTLIIKSIDRLGRDFNEIIEQWRHITLEKKCGIVVPIQLPQNFDFIWDLWAQGELSGREAARQLGVDNHTFAKWAKELG